MRNLSCYLLLVVFASCSDTSELKRAVNLIDEKEIAHDILVLASDSLLGRALFTVGEEKTLEYITQRMQQIGLQPAFDGSYLQEVPLVEITSYIPDEVGVNTRNGRISMTAGNEFTLWSNSLIEKIELSDSKLVFVGFGIQSPEWSWNDFEGIDLKGKTIVVLVNDPGFHTNDTSLFNGRSMTYYGRWRYKFEEAERQGAAGCIIVHEDEAAGYPWSVVNGRTNRPDFFIDNDNLINPTCKVQGWITRESAVKLFSACGQSYEQLKVNATKKGFKPIDLNAEFSVIIENKWEKSVSQNVAGFIKGNTKPHEVLVYCAHWDHFGVGLPFNGDSIYNGASDNAAAIAWMFGMAKAFKSVEGNLERSILFLSPTAEEAGMLGAQYYVDHSPFPMQNTIACFNNDVVLFLGRFLDVTITGPEHSDLDGYLEIEAKKMGRYICNDPNPENGMFYRSDHLPFVKAGVPSLFAKGYSHQEELGREKTLQEVANYWANTYHKPSDHYVPQVHKLEGLVDDAKLFFRLGYTLATEEYYPRWNRKSEFFVDRFEN